MKLALGTAQFGLDYGITNASGLVAPAEVATILAAARTLGVDMLDTASGYGDSERVLGSTGALDGFQVVTKTAAIRKPRVEATDVARVRQVFFESLRRLGVPRVEALLVHHAEDLLADGSESLYEALRELQAEGYVDKLGASIYTADQLERLFERYALDIVQLPLSVLDQRLVASGWLSRLAAAGVEVHGRSVFLQGLLLIAPRELPAHFAPLVAPLEAYWAALAAAGMSPLEGALRFAAQQPGLGRALVGVTSRAQLIEVASALAARSDQRLDFEEFACNDERLLNPALWPPMHELRRHP